VRGDHLPLRECPSPQHPPTIDLDGARLRPLRVADADALYAYLRNPVVTELTSYPVASLRMAEAMIERSLSRWAAGELSKWGVALQQNDQLVGTCGFNEWSQAHHWAELAFDLAQVHWGKGLMRKAVAAVLQWTYRQDLVNRVHAFVRVDIRSPLENRLVGRIIGQSGYIERYALAGIVQTRSIAVWRSGFRGCWSGRELWLFNPTETLKRPRGIPPGCLPCR
jgi:[ribosomal protein S5]-alanine N-acetyltransferase